MDEELYKFGYAPGDYVILIGCRNCHKELSNVSKRAWSCEKCAREKMEKLETPLICDMIRD